MNEHNDKDPHIEWMIWGVVKDFDFSEVQKYMTMTHWTWENSKKPPSLTELREEAKHLLREVAYGDCYTAMTGGLMAIAHSKENIRNMILELFFVPTCGSCSYEESKEYKQNYRKL